MPRVQNWSMIKKILKNAKLKEKKNEKIKKLTTLKWDIKSTFKPLCSMFVSWVDNTFRLYNSNS